MANTNGRSSLMPFILGLIVGLASFYLIRNIIDDGLTEPCESWNIDDAPNKIRVAEIDPGSILTLDIGGESSKGGVFNKCDFNYLVSQCEGESISYRFANIDGKVGLYLADNFIGDAPSEWAFFTATEGFCPMRCE